MSRYAVPPESPFALLPDDEIRAWYAFMKVQLRLRYEMNGQLRRDSGISLVDYDVLVALTSESTGTMAVSDLAIRIGAERSRVSHQTRRMAARRWVTLHPRPDDRRITDVALTDDGRAMLVQASPAHIDFVRSVFLEALSPRQAAELSDVFERVFDRLIDRGTLPRPVDRP